jgi:hypothetical protein
VLLRGVQPLKLMQGKAFLELDAVACHGLTGILVPVYALRRGFAE